MLPNHIHGPNCGCKDYAFSEENEDLLSSIVLDKVVCFNEFKFESCKKMFRSKETKFDKSDILESNEDPELLLVIPFDCIIKLKTITLIAKDSETSPQLMKVFSNQENIDFSLVQDQTPLQEFEVSPNLDGSLEYSVKISKFQNVHKLILYFSNEDIAKIAISYICLKGVKTNIKPQIVQAVYESKPMLSDHKAKGGDFINKKFID